MSHFFAFEKNHVLSQMRKMLWMRYDAEKM